MSVKRILEVIETPEYNQRHVLSTKAVSLWTPEEIAIQKQHNRILQEGYSSLAPDEILRIAKIAKMDWLTDFICPNPAFACKLNIAADLITQFKVSAEELNDKTQEIFNFIIDQNKNFLTQVKTSIEEKLQVPSMLAEIKDKALGNLKKQYPKLSELDSSYHETLLAFNVVEMEIAKKQITHTVLMEVLQPLYPTIASKFELQYKTLYAKGDNKDFSFLGAAGSGKSSIAKKLVKEDKRDYVVLATDDYRGVILDSRHETRETDQIFTRTQDTAYSIKEIVKQRLEFNPQKRPNIILDCVSLEKWHQELLSGNNATVSAVACLNDISMVPLRALLRAEDKTAGPADIGRKANTTALLSGHAFASARLLSSIPVGVQTTLVDTNVKKGTDSQSIAIIDTSNGKHDISVLDLSKLSTFLCKANVNPEASFKGELYRDTKKQTYRFTYDAHYQAEQVLNLVKVFPPFKQQSYNVTLSEEKTSKPYMQITLDKNNKLQLKVLDKEVLLNLLNQDKSEAKVLMSIAMQIFSGTLDKARENMRSLGRHNAESIALEKLVPEIKRIMPRERKKGDERSFQEATPTLEKRPKLSTNDTKISFRRKMM